MSDINANTNTSTETETRTKELIWGKPDLAKGTVTLAARGLETISFNLREELFTGEVWDKFDDVQKLTVVNGFKQKSVDLLAGKGAKASYSPAERIDLVLETVNRLFDDRLWNKPAVARGPSDPKAAARKAIAELEVNEAKLREGLKAVPKEAKKAVSAFIDAQIKLLVVGGKTLAEWKEIVGE